jgi:tetratricopeptide (TPR) repeat protein
MPTRNYMVVDPRRDHSLRVPRPDLSVSLKTPNACTGCHTDRPAEGAAAQVVDWYGRTRPDDPHPGPALAAGLAALLRREDVSPIVRASAASLLGHYPEADRRAALAKLLADPHPLVRFGAVKGLDRNPGEDLARLLPPLLDDPVRLVRTEAARALAHLGPDGVPATAKEAFRRARAEYEEAQLATAEVPGAHLNLGVIREQFGEFDRAESEYRAALRIDPRFTPARYNLAMLHNRRGDRPAAERALRELTEQEPNAADAHYSLGLLLAEDERRLSEAAEALAQAARLAPERARVQYNYGLALQRLGKYREAEEALRRAHEREPALADVVYALAVLNAQQKRWGEARAWADKLARIDPHNPTWQQFLLQIRRQQR